MDLDSAIAPPTAGHTHTVVFLHARGDTARNFAHSLAFSPDSQGYSLTETFPSFRWVFPSSKLRPCASDHGSNRSQWFDLLDLHDLRDGEELQAVGLKESVQSIRNVLAKEADILGGLWDRLILMGISQGGATSVHTLLNLDLRPGETGTSRRLGAFLGFSCWMPLLGRNLADTRAMLGLANVPNHDQALRQTPVMLQHCADDPLIPVAHGHALRETLAEFGVIVEWKEYSDGGHWFKSPEGIDDVVKFIRNKVPGMASAESPSNNSMRTPDVMYLP